MTGMDKPASHPNDWLCSFQLLKRVHCRRISTSPAMPSIANEAGDGKAELASQVKY
jgi:hypothetical protein